MSHAFVKENDDQWLDDVSPTVSGLIVYLTRENNGNTMYEKRNFYDQVKGKEIHEMSHGFSYEISNEGKWQNNRMTFYLYDNRLKSF